MVRFSFNIQYIHALEGGPWMVQGHYITVSKWRPFFSTKNEVVTSTLAWVRISDLPLELFDDGALLKLGNLIGKAVKVDHTTTCVGRGQGRGKYARICVEINLQKPLGSRIKVNGKVFNVEYECLSQICFNCELYGHVVEDCGSKQGVDIVNDSKMRPKEDLTAAPYGPWMMQPITGGLESKLHMNHLQRFL